MGVLSSPFDSPPEALRAMSSALLSHHPNQLLMLRPPPPQQQPVGQVGLDFRGIHSLLPACEICVGL